MKKTPLDSLSLDDLFYDSVPVIIGGGWPVPPLSDMPAHISGLLMLHAEVSEAAEALRKGDLANYKEEMADIFIRWVGLVASAHPDIKEAIADKLAYNKTRPYRHGNKLF